MDGGIDRLDQIIEEITAGGQKEQYAVAQRIDLSAGDGSSAPDQLVWAEVGRLHTTFYSRQEPSIRQFPTASMSIPNERLREFSEVASMAADYERGRIPPSIMDAEEVIKQLIAEHIKQHGANIPADVRDALNKVGENLVPQWGVRMGKRL